MQKQYGILYHMYKEIDIYIEYKKWYRFSQLVRKIAYEVLRYKKNLISITLTHSTPMKAINAKSRGKNNSTDILSFPVSYWWYKQLYLGDIILSYEDIKAKAKLSGYNMRGYVKMILVHGILHLLGYDHETDEDWYRMRKVEHLLSEKLKPL